MKETMMRLILLAALGITAFSATMTIEAPEANAVVYCAAGVYRAGCVVRPVVAPVVGVRGVARRTTRRVVRRSDMMLKHDIFLIGHLENGLGFYRFTYNGGNKAYVGVMAQEVQTIMPTAVQRGSDGYLRVSYDMLGVKFQTYDQWTASGAHVPAGTPVEQ
jgi:endosialidase-like protein